MNVRNDRKVATSSEQLGVRGDFTGARYNRGEERKVNSQAETYRRRPGVERGQRAVIGSVAVVQDDRGVETTAEGRGSGHERHAGATTLLWL